MREPMSKCDPDLLRAIEPYFDLSNIPNTLAKVRHIAKARKRRREREELRIVAKALRKYDRKRHEELKADIAKNQEPHNEGEGI